MSRQRQSVWTQMFCGFIVIAFCCVAVLLSHMGHVPRAIDSAGVFEHVAMLEMGQEMEARASKQVDDAAQGAVGSGALENGRGSASMSALPQTLESKVQPCSGSQLRIRTVVAPSVTMLQYHGLRVEAIRQTWGRSRSYKLTDGRCVAWEVNFAHEASAFETPSLLVPMDDESTPPPAIQALGKSAAVVHNILHEFTRVPGADWVFKVDDCTLVIPEHAIELVLQYDADKPFLLGSHLRNRERPAGQLFASGAGFALSRGALRRMQDAQSNPDGSMAEWLKKDFNRPGDLSEHPAVGISAFCRELGVEMPDTRDLWGGERFNAFPPVPSVMGAYHGWFLKYKAHAGQTPFLGAGATVGLRRDVRCCGDDRVVHRSRE